MARETRASAKFPMLGSVRLRTTVAAVAVVSIALAIGAGGMFLLLRRSLIGTLKQSTQLQASAVVSLVAEGELPKVLPGRTSLVQVIAPSGTVIAATPDAQGAPLVATHIDRTAPMRITVQSRLGPPRFVSAAEGPWLVEKRIVFNREGVPLAIWVATSLDTLNEVLSHLALALGIGLPMLVALVGVMAWVLAGRALRPVEEIRVEVAEISARHMDRRISEPLVADEVGRLARTMNTMLDRLEEASARQRGFVADASHELRTPLAAIQAQLEVALAHPEGDWRVAACDALEEARHMTGIVEDLLNLARADGPAAGAPASVDLDELVLDEAARLRSLTSVSVDVSRVSAGRVLGYRSQLRSVVRNLGDNAARHANSQVSFELGVEAECVALVVCDDGGGIPVDDQERVFERFTRLDEARNRQDGGAGLGLAIVREIVTRHGGHVSVASADMDVGTRMRVTIPKAPS